MAVLFDSFPTVANKKASKRLVFHSKTDFHVQIMLYSKYLLMISTSSLDKYCSD